MFFPGRRRHLERGFGPAHWAGICLAILGISGCNERDRLTFPVNDGQGPQVTIITPAQDTTVAEGPFAQVGGRVTDEDGIDTVYFEVTGGGASFQPYLAMGADTVTFSLPLATAGFSGITMTLAVFATDVGGVRGDTAVRQVTVQ
jgi:hypothetical protein